MRGFKNIRQPPHPYFDIRNKAGDSPFKPGLPSDDYTAFINHFEERARTAHAQAALYQRKNPGEVAAWKHYAAGWSKAAEVCRARQQKSMRAEEARAAEIAARQAQAEYNAGAAARAEERRRAVSEETD